MAKRCVYCSCEIADDRCVDVCDTCGLQVWGTKMFSAIKQSMGEANEKGDLFQGCVGGCRLDNESEINTK